MPNNSFYVKVFDGYALNSADGYSCVSQPVKVQEASLVSVSAVFSGGTPSGTLKVQVTSEGSDQSVSSRAPGSQGNGGTAWVDYLGSSGSVAISATGNIFIDLGWRSAGWYRVVYTATSGTTVLNCWVRASS